MGNEKKKAAPSKKRRTKRQADEQQQQAEQRPPVKQDAAELERATLAAQAYAKAHGSSFKPSTKQISMLAQFLTADEGTTIVAMCASADISSSTYYRWLQRSDFRHWWNECTETVLRGKRSAVLSALTRRAEQGDLSAIKVWLQRFDRIESGDRQTMQDLYRDLIRRFATEEFINAKTKDDDDDAEASD